jgi:hypothetical protein
VSDPATLLYRFPGAERIVSARVAPTEFIPLIDDFYAAYRCRLSDSELPVDQVIELEYDGGVYRVTVPSGDWEAESEGDAVLFYEYELTDALLTGADEFVNLHGTAVVRESRSMLLLGPSGTGKSTLALALSLAGWQTIADDALLIDPGTGEVQPFDRSIRVHESSLRALDVDHATIEGARFCEPYLWLKVPESGAPGLLNPDALVFLRSGAATSIERLDVTNTLRELLIARLSDQSERDFDCLARLAAEVPGYLLSFEGFPEALAELESL